MRKDGEKLIFSEGESSDLLCAFARYFDSPKAGSLDPATSERLHNMRQYTGELVAMNMIREFYADMDETERNALAYGIVSKSLPEGTKYVTKDTKEIELDNSDHAITQIISWAAQNLYPGSTAVQNIVGKTLNSSHEDHPLSRTFASTNEKMANRMAKSAIAAGRTATKWLSQLETE